ncbi:MAG TPA: hypothetical protein ENH82_06665 [bacterium]|nr:hypothetical protein [bacterium]
MLLGIFAVCFVIFTVSMLAIVFGEGHYSKVLFRIGLLPSFALSGLGCIFLVFSWVGQSFMS